MWIFVFEIFRHGLHNFILLSLEFEYFDRGSEGRCNPVLLVMKFKFTVLSMRKILIYRIGDTLLMVFI